MQGDKARQKIAAEARLAAINAIYGNLTEAERAKFIAWRKQNVKPGGKLKDFDWPGLQPYLVVLGESLLAGQDAKTKTKIRPRGTV